MAPLSPDVDKHLRQVLADIQAAHPGVADVLRIRTQPRHFGQNDGTIYPPDDTRIFPEGTSMRAVRAAALEKEPLRGQIKVLVVLVDFPDKPFSRPDITQHVENMFFGPENSASTFYNKASHGAVTLAGAVVGPYRLEQPMAWYANNKSGMGLPEPNSGTMAQHAIEKVNADLKVQQLASYDNNGDGFMDAFVVVHAGQGAEEVTDVQRGSHIWSVKWVLMAGAYMTRDKVKVYSFLTVPESMQLGVVVHEVGHLLFGWPDFYDYDASSAGLGTWCLMSGGSWNRTAQSGPAGSCPSEPSAWCKLQQGWVEALDIDRPCVLQLSDVKDSGKVVRFFLDDSRLEYFLIENRQQQGFDAGLAGSGLLVFHVDERIESNNMEWHPKVALEQADGKFDLNYRRNYGDAGDTWKGHLVFSDDSLPNARSYYSNRRSGLILQNFSPSAKTMTFEVQLANVVRPRGRSAAAQTGREAADVVTGAEDERGRTGTDGPRARTVTNGKHVAGGVHSVHGAAMGEERFEHLMELLLAQQKINNELLAELMVMHHTTHNGKLPSLMLH